jgi:hypothetical protein
MEIGPPPRGKQDAMPDNPRDRDVVAWSEQQAEALRRYADQHPDVAIDWPRVIDTVERAGRGLLDEIEAEIVRALYWHLMLATYPEAANRREWQAAAERGRRVSRTHMAAGTRPRIDLRRLYARAMREVRHLGPIGAAEPRALRGECPISLDEWLGEDLDAEALLRRMRA